MSEDTATDGRGEVEQVLPEAAAQTLYVALAEAADYDGEYLLEDDVDHHHAMYEAVAPVVAALVAQARADGAAEERERIAAALEAEADSTFNQTRAVNWRRAALMARGPS